MRERNKIIEHVTSLTLPELLQKRSSNETFSTVRSPEMVDTRRMKHLSDSSRNKKNGVEFLGVST
jgi:hypothetical protein